MNQAFFCTCFLIVAVISLAQTNEFLTEHNIYRCMHGVPLLQWDSCVADNAQQWANGGVMQHDHAYDLTGCAGPAGENLAQGQRSVAEAVGDWYSEQSAYSYGGGGFSGATGHFTAMVWRGATKLGCGRSGDLYVCRYKGGDTLDCNTPNMQGCFDQNVPPPTGKSRDQCAAEVAGGGQQATSPPQPATQAPAPVTQAPAPVTEAPQPVTAAPVPVTDAPAAPVPGVIRTPAPPSVPQFTFPPFPSAAPAPVPTDPVPTEAPVPAPSSPEPPAPSAPQQGAPQPTPAAPSLPGLPAGWQWGPTTQGPWGRWQPMRALGNGIGNGAFRGRSARAAGAPSALREHRAGAGAGSWSPFGRGNGVNLAAAPSLLAKGRRSRSARLRSRVHALEAEADVPEAEQGGAGAGVAAVGTAEALAVDQGGEPELVLGHARRVQG